MRVLLILLCCLVMNANIVFATNNAVNQMCTSTKFSKSQLKLCKAYWKQESISIENKDEKADGVFELR